MKSRIAIAAALTAITGSAHGCCISFGNLIMRLARERAIIVWDQAGKTEHFIRSATFEGNAKDFGFILPTPTEPSGIEIADEIAFNTLEALEPRRTTGDAAMTEGVTKSAAAMGGVEILQQKTLGDYEVTVLKASDGKSIGDWLQKNGHKMRPAMEPWLDHYAKQGWILTAFKYKGGARVETKAVRVSFAAEQPHYPYKMPSDTWTEGHYRQMSLFLVSQSKMKGKYTTGRDWETKAKWDANVDSNSRLSLSRSLKDDKGLALDLPESLVVTRFENVEEANNYESDLTFEPDNPPYWAIYFGLGGFGMAAYSFWRKKRVLEQEAQE